MNIQELLQADFNALDSDARQTYADELRQTILHHAKLYYVDDAPVISDYDYDRLYRKLLILEEEYPELYDPASPTQRVGGKPLDKFEKVTHTSVMNSLTDVFSFDELKDFLERVSKDIPDALYSVEPKIDGLSVSISYVDGVLFRAATRGDGLVGEDSFSWGDSYRLLTADGARGISHADMIDLNRENIRGFDVREFYVDMVADLKKQGL